MNNHWSTLQAALQLLIDLGYADAMARRDELEAFLGGTRPRYLPLPPLPAD